jgi:ribosomal protein S18 acetylase RimI-like enzyme
MSDGSDDSAELITFHAASSTVAAHDAALPATCSLRILQPQNVTPALATQILPLLSAGFDDRPWSEEVGRSLVLTEDTLLRVLLVLESERHVGMTTLHVGRAEGEGLLHWMVVDEGSRRRGIAKLLAVETARQALSLGLPAITLQTETYRTAAIAMYRKLGFG